MERKNLLPNSLKKLVAFFENLRFSRKMIFIITSVLATLWFLIRVIPKPSRAAYPCMRVAAPIMSSFIIWLLTVSGAWFSFKKAKQKLLQAKYLVGFSLVISGVIFSFLLVSSNPKTTKANVKIWYSPNQPVGEAKGINPGRVAWTHSDDIATWDGKTGFWWEDKYINQDKADGLLKESIIQLTGEKTAKDAWKALFVSFNKTKHGKDAGYSEGEKIAIKINMNNTYGHENTNEINTSPQLTLALLRSLVNDAGVPQKNIILTEPSRFITDNIFNKCHSEFPDIIYEDNGGGSGRVKSTYVTDALPYSVDNGRLARNLAKSIVDANYLIDLAVLKGHVGQGVTLCGKNWYGATSIHADWHKNVHNNFDQNRDGSPRYMTFVDFMGHKDLGNKTMLFLVDGIISNKSVDGVPAYKWQMAPFNNNWPGSVFASQDMVAIDAVCMDFILNEWPDAPDLQYCDSYLLEAAQANNPPSGTKYDPERDGTTLNSLGVMEHWNNATDKQYTRNLGTGNGIELLYYALN